MDQLSPAEKAEVEGYLKTYPELRKELRGIEITLETYAASAAIDSPSGVKEKILVSIRASSVGNNSVRASSSVWPLAAAFLGLGLLLLGYLYFQKDKDVQHLEQQIIAARDTCQNTTNELSRQLSLLRQLTQPGNKILPFTATAGFASTDLYFHTNKQTKRNFIQVRNLPAITSNQSYELWSIKANQPPKPLDVFDKPGDGVIEVAYVDDTEVYAITIEPKGGKNSPTMENLIGTVSVAGI